MYTLYYTIYTFCLSSTRIMPLIIIIIVVGPTMLLIRFKTWQCESMQCKIFHNIHFIYVQVQVCLWFNTIRSNESFIERLLLLWILSVNFILSCWYWYYEHWTMYTTNKWCVGEVSIGMNTRYCIKLCMKLNHINHPMKLKNFCKSLWHIP